MLSSRVWRPTPFALSSSSSSEQASLGTGFAWAQTYRYIKKWDWLICLWRRAADVFVKDAGYQALIGQAFLGGSSLQHLKVGGR